MQLIEKLHETLSLEKKWHAVRQLRQASVR